MRSVHRKIRPSLLLDWQLCWQAQPSTVLLFSSRSDHQQRLFVLPYRWVGTKWLAVLDKDLGHTADAWILLFHRVPVPLSHYANQLRNDHMGTHAKDQNQLSQVPSTRLQSLLAWHLPELEEIPQISHLGQRIIISPRMVKFDYAIRRGKDSWARLQHHREQVLQLLLMTVIIDWYKIPSSIYNHSSFSNFAVSCLSSPKFEVPLPSSLTSASDIFFFISP